MMDAEENTDWGDFPEVEEMKRVGEVQGVSAETAPPAQPGKRQLVELVVRTLRSHFDDELMQVKDPFFEAEYAFDGNSSAQKGYNISSTFSADVLSDLDKMIEEEEHEPRSFSITHHPWANQGAETRKDVFPYFDFSVELPLHDESFGDGGCRVNVKASSIVDVDQKTLEKVFSYARQYEGVKKVVYAVLEMHGVPQEHKSVLEGMMDHLAPFNLSDPEKHVILPNDELGLLSYELNVELTVLPGSVRVVFRDTSGLMFKAGNIHQAVYAYISSADGNRTGSSFSITENFLEEPGDDPEDNRFITVLEKRY